MTGKWFQISEGWRRFVLAISFIWIVVSNALYLSDLGGTLRASWDSSEPLPTWMTIWYRSTLGLAPHLYEFATFSIGSILSENFTSTTTFEYSAIGHVAFVIIPLFFLIAITSLTAWVVAGFTTSRKSIDETDS